VSALIDTIIHYVASLASIFVMSLIIDALAPQFGGQKNFVQAFKLSAYASTSFAVSSAALILPVIGQLITLVGAVYGLYLLYLGIPVLMKSPKEKSLGYTALAVVITFVIAIVLALVFGRPSGGAPGAAESGIFEKGGLAAKVEEAGKKLEAAQKSGDVQAQQQAMKQMASAALTGGDVVEALAPEKIRAFLPESMAGLARTDASAERNEAMGMQISNARAVYTDGASKALTLEITDMASTKGFAAAASWASLQQDKETDRGFEKTYKADGRMIHEEWDREAKNGEYSVIVGERFEVKITGPAENIDALKSAAGAVDLSGLEALKDEGVKTGG
jgi:hypothetical protein